MKILFVYPDITRAVSPQLGICMIAAAAKTLGHDCDIYDLTTIKMGDEFSSFKSKIREYRPDILAVSCRSNEWPFVVQLLQSTDTSKMIKMAGGPHATVSPEEVIELFDVVVIGEGEETFAELLNRISEGADYSGVAGCWVRHAGRIIRNDVRNLIADLDALPFPDWSIFDDIHYNRSYILRLIKEARIAGTFEGSRGCPFACTYCTNDYVRRLYKGKGKWRREKSPERIMAELKKFRAAYGLDCVYWTDEIVLTDVERLKKFRDLYVSEIGVPFFFMERPENMTDEKVRIIKEAGAYSVSIGIESGDEKLRTGLLNRRHSQEKIVSAFQTARKYGIKTHAFTMIGFPFEDRESIYRSYQLLKEAKPDSVQTTIFYPLRKTKLWQTVVDEKLLEHDADMAINYYDKSCLNFSKRKKKDILRYQLLLTHYNNAFMRFLVEARLSPAFLRFLISTVRAPGIVYKKIKGEGAAAAVKAIGRRLFKQKN